MNQYPIEAQEREYAEFVDELAHTQHADLVAKYLDLSKQYNYLADRHSRAVMWVYVLAVIVAMFVAIYWLRMPFPNPYEN